MQSLGENLGTKPVAQLAKADAPDQRATIRFKAFCLCRRLNTALVFDRFFPSQPFIGGIDDQRC